MGGTIAGDGKIQEQGADLKFSKARIHTGRLDMPRRFKGLRSRFFGNIGYLAVS